MARAAKALGRALPALVLMTDDARLSDPLAAARALPKGSMVVARARDGLEKLARALLKTHCTVLVAGDPLLASRLGAHGIHLPEARAGEAAYWRARFPGMLITASAHSLRALRRDHVDAFFLSPVFETKSHPGRAPLGAVRASLIARQARVPVYALGGVDARNAALLSGFRGIAAIGALTP
ncbi:MAG TPA: thiamine phosphate synthase [Rhizomicrobium sp.]|nr:thiamine phosphate synthase [Rhizomicrobium sp.]